MNEIDRPARHWIARDIPAVVAAICLSAASIVLAGWIFDLPLLQSEDSGRVSMKANTALAFVLSSLALLFAARRPSPMQATARWGLAITIALIAILTLIEYVARVDLGIDQLLAPAAGDMLLTTSPGRMSPTTAIGFLAFAAAMIIDHWSGFVARTIRRAILSVLILLAIGAILGYAYGAPSMYLGIDGVTAMALSTAILFFILALGGIWLRPQYGLPAILMERSLLGANVRALVPMVVGAPLLVGAAVAAGYGRYYEGAIAVALTSLGSVVAATLIATISIVILRKSEAAMIIKDRALEATPNGVIITDHLSTNDPIIYVNPAFTRMTGYESEEAIGKNCRFLNHDPENTIAIRDDIKRCINTGDSATVELQNKRKDGELFWNRLSISPVQSRDGIVTHFVGVLDDITDEKLQQEQLENALEETRSANSVRNTFVRLISHELRTPLNSALTWIRLMEVDDRNTTREKGLRVIADSVESQSRLIDDLVDVTRYARSGIRIEKETVDVREIVAATIESLRPAIEEEQELDIVLEDGEYVFDVDPIRYQQIVRNLMSNAHKYTPPGGCIQVRLIDDGTEVLLRVADTGRGLRREDIRKVFEPFWRAESHQPGLGVGLAIVASLVSAHGGSIEVHSDGLDEGAEFTVRIPKQSAIQSDEPGRVDLVSG